MIDSDSTEAAQNGDSIQDQYLTFKMGQEEFGLEIKHIIEIIGMQTINRVPDMPDFMVGVINLRGKVIPVLDMRRRFHLPVRDHDNRTCIIVVDIENVFVGLLVDQVSEVIEIKKQDIEPLRAGKLGGNRYLQGLGKIGQQVKILLDARQIVGSDLLGTLKDDTETAHIQ
ncbi:MAG: purine-binding chemotaxis protein CheW [Desulfuromonadaceae bacterium]|nr:purine-binding chemotaxis protein CheW [Desulfuromonadaceae bacterium]